jgi:IS605 OrfB family transposase
VRQTFLHAVSSQLIQTHDRLCLEDLAVANLLSNRYLAGAIADAAWTEFARQLSYKAVWFGSDLVMVEPMVPILQDLLTVREGPSAAEIGRTHLSLRRLRPDRRPGPQRRRQSPDRLI